MKLSYTNFRIMLLFLSLLIASVHTFSFSNMYAVQSNVGQTTDYYISFTPTQAYNSNVNAKIDFPLQYDLAQISSQLQCYISSTGQPNSYSQVACDIQPNLDLTQFYTIGAVVVYIDQIDAIRPINIVLRNIKNPSSQSSSFFSVCLRNYNYLLECEKQFQRLLFTPTFSTFVNGTGIVTVPQVAYVGQGNTYQFSMNTNILNLATTFNLNTENMKIRVIFPQYFNSSTPVCSLVKYSLSGGSTSNAFLQQNTSVTPSKTFSVECNNIYNLSSFIDTSGVNAVIKLKIQNMYNPSWSGSFSGAYIEICRSNHHQIIERISFPQTMIVMPEQLNGNVRQSNMMRNSTNQYFFTISHDLFLDETSSIVVTIGNNTLWDIISARLLSGFSQPSTLNYTIVETFGVQSVVTLSNYGSASNKMDQIFAINLTSPAIIGTQSVKIQTFVNNQLSGTWNGQVELNSTWGAFNMLSFSAVRPAVKLPHGQTGPLQLTFFLNYQLPPSQSIQNGTMIVSFSPPIPTPDPNIYGVVKCYWKGNLQSANCTYDNSDPTKTVVTMQSPPYDYFQYSQIPIIITTEGGIDTDHLGLTIDPMVQRYKFSTQFYLYNSSTIPSQVFYTTWTTDAIELPTVTTLTAHSLTYECLEQTSIQINITTPLLNLPSLTYDQRIIVQFLPDGQASAWSNNLGYLPNKIYKQYPCVVIGLSSTNIQCDLYTYSTIKGPYNNLNVNSYFFGPFIMIYGFDSFPATGLNVIIQLPKIKLSNIPGINAIISLSIVGETPGQTQPYIQYYHQNMTLFQTSPSISMATNVIASSMGSVQVQTANQYVVTWNPLNLASIQYIKYEFHSNILPSLITQSATCSGNCYSAGYPANWIVQTINPSSPNSLTTLANFITSMNYIPDLTDIYPLDITTYDINGHTLDKYQMQITYIPQPITSSAFILLDSAGIIYSGLKQWYEIDFTTTNALTSAYPYVRLILTNQMKFASPPQCNSTSIMAYNQSGIQCEITDINGQELVIWNIAQLSPLTAYEMNVRLQTSGSQYSMIITPSVQIQICHNYTVLDSFISYQPGQMLTQAQIPQMSQPAQFTINNPQILNQEVRVNYIGRVFFDFISTTSLTIDLKIYFGDHRYNTGFWSTPNQLDTDPVVCMLNNARFACSPTNSPLNIYITQAQIKVGSSRLQIDTQYIAPYNGIRFPLSAGHFPITISAVISGVQTIKSTFFVYVHPAQLLHLQVGSIVKDIATQSVFLVNFTIDSTKAIPSANHDLTSFSRIFVEFPTIVDGQRVFQDNLGGYQGLLNQRVGCSFMLNSPYVAAQASSLLQCRLIPPPASGDPATVQLINFDTFSASLTSVAIWIFKVFTPVTAFDSVDIKIKINQYTTNGAQIYPLFQSKYTVFLDPHTENVSPIEYASVESPLTAFFQTSLDVGDYGTITMNAHLVGGASLADPFFMLVKLPNYLLVQNQQISPAFSSPCPSSSFQYCVTAPDVNYVLVKVLVNQSIFTFYIKNFPISISLQDSYYDSMIINSGRYLGNIQYDISPTRWQTIQGVITYNYQQAVGLTQKATLNKQKFHFLISFSIANYIPPQGTVQIGFPSSVTKIYPNCRSVASNGSLLFSASGTSGEIGCSVQNGNKWTITGFAQVIGPFPLTIVISGFVDLPPTAGQLGMGHITTYANNDPTDIFTNGSRIDHIDVQYDLTVQNILAMNPNQNVFLSQRNPVLAGNVGQFRFIMQTNTQITSTGSITIDFYQNDIFGNAGGFVYVNNKKVCQIIDIATETRIGCIVLSEVQLSGGSPKYISTFIQPVQNLQMSTQYEIRLTTQTYSYPATPQGIHYPTVASTYKIDISMKQLSSSTAKTQQLYLQVYGTPFSQLTVTQYNYLAGQYNVYWFQLSPTTNIAITHRIVIQFPTLSNDIMTRLFDNDLGLYEYPDGGQIAFDIFDSSPLVNTFMTCHIFHGDFTRAIPVRVICAKFTQAIPMGQILRFAIGIRNPTLNLMQLSIPIFIYSQDSYYFRKTNFNIWNTGGYIFDKPYIISPNGYFSTTSLQLEMPNDNLLLGDAHTYPLLINDAFLIKFNFPIRVNGKFVGACMDSAQVNTYGDAYYHERLRVIICKVTTVSPAAQISPAAVTMLIKNFYSPWYLLANGWERQVYAVAHYYSLSISEVITYQDSFPILSSRYVFPTPPDAAVQSILTKQPVLGHMTICQRDDYIFTAIIDNSATGATTFDLQYTNLVGIFFPLNTVVDYNFFNTDCIQHPSSQVQVISCYIDFVARAIYIEIQRTMYSNNKIVAVQTKGLAIQNPCTLWASDLMSLFTVSYFSWTNITATNKKSSNIIYMSIDARNMAPYAYSYVYQASNLAASTYYNPFDWVEVPYERYFNQFPQYKSGQYSPFKFDLYLTTALATKPSGSYHKLTLYYGNSYTSLPQQTANDLYYNKPVCYLYNTRVQRCFNDDTNKLIYMQFEFGLPAGNSVSLPDGVNVYFSVQDPRNTDINGFQYISSTTDIDSVYLQLVEFGNAVPYIFNPSPFEAKQTNAVPVSAVLPQRVITSTTVDYANAIAGQLNLIDISLTLSRADITGVLLQIPLVNEAGQQIYGTNSRTAFFSLNDGDEYPCGNNGVGVTSKAKCLLYHGENIKLGTSTKILVTDFTYAGNVLYIRVLLYNPIDVGVWFSINAKVYTGAPTDPATSLFGHQYRGYWRFFNLFQTVTTASYYANSVTNVGASYVYPSTGLWRSSTTMSVTSNVPFYGGFPAGQYMIFQVLLSNYAAGTVDDQYCFTQWTLGSTSSDDMIYLKHRQSLYDKAFFIKKFTVSPWSIQYLKCKHYANPFTVYYNIAKNILYQIGHTINMPSFDSSTYTGTTVLDYFQITDTRTFVQIDLTFPINNIIAAGFVWQNNINYYLYIQISGFFFPSFTSCQVAGGFLNTMGGMPTCTGSTTYLIITNFQQIIYNTRLAKYSIKIDVQCTYASSYGYNFNYAYPYLYSNSDSYSYGQWIFYSTSMYKLRQIPYWSSGTTSSLTTCSGLYSTWTAPVYYNQLFLTKNLVSTINQVTLTASTLTLVFTIQPTVDMNVMTASSGHFYFRFFLDGIKFTCSSVSSFSGRYFNGSSYVTTNLAGGFQCSYPSYNYFIYNSQVDSARQWGSVWGNAGNTFFTTHNIEFTIVLNVVSVPEVSTYRDWIALKVFLNQISFSFYSSCGVYCCTYCYCNYWSRSYAALGYGDDYYPRQPLFSSASFGALSKIANKPTQIIITLNIAQIPFGAASTAKILLLQFNTGSTTLFPYVNATATNNNQIIQCFCIKSNFSNFAGSSSYSPQCTLRFPQGTLIYTAISIDLDVLTNQYVQCYFPGFLTTTESTYSVKAKLINQDSSYPIFVQNDQEYGGNYLTTSSSLIFTNNVPGNTLTVTQTPSLYDSSNTAYINTVNSAYTLSATFGSLLASPIIYIDFQKGGPIPTSTMCSNLAKYQNCRVYNTIRNILVVQFVNNVNVMDFYLATVSLPKQKQKDMGSDFNLIVLAMQAGETQYTFYGSMTRYPTYLLPTAPTLNIYADQIVGTNVNTLTTPLVISFTLSGQTIKPMYLNNNAQMIITYDQAIVLANQGCTVTTASVSDAQGFFFYCSINSATKTITIANKYYNKGSFTASGVVQVIIGITNINVNTNFNLKLYSYYYDANTYGLLIDTSGVYVPWTTTGKSVMTRGQTRMYPFNTKVYSSTMTPYRMGFKLSSLSPSLVYSLPAVNFFILDGFDILASYTLFQCLIKQYTTQPTASPQTPQTNSYRNYRQNTQYIPLYTYCTLINSTALNIQIPRYRTLDSTKYYELVIMPVSATNTGFTNVADSLYKFIAWPNSNQYIGSVYAYTLNKITMSSMYVVTTRPLQPTAIQLQFTLATASALVFPSHYIEIIFKDLTLDALVPPYNILGQSIPCSLSSNFLITARIQTPNCVVNYNNYLHQIITIRVQNIGNLAAGTYKISLDYFLLPDLTSLLQRSQAFKVWLVFHSTVSHFQKYVGELFLIDGYTNNVSRMDLATAVFHDAPDLRYGKQISPKFQISYPMTSTGTIDQKIMIRIFGGYSATSPAPILFSGTLWYNPMLNLYILQQSSISSGTQYNFTLSNVFNPQPYQMQEYENSNIYDISITLFNNYMPNTNYIVNQTAYPSFVPNTPLVKIGTVFSDDVKNTIPSNTFGIFSTSITILQSYANIATYEQVQLDLVFTANVNQILKCWVDTIDGVQYSSLTVCSTTSATSITLYNFDTSNTNHNLTLYILMKTTSGSTISYTSNLYCANGQLQYTSSSSYTFTTITASTSAFSTLSFTQNHYTPYYFQPLVTPLTQSSVPDMLYFSMFIPTALIQANSIFTIYLNASLSIAPNHPADTLLMCQWMQVTQYGRAYITGKYSICNYVAPNIVIQSPLWGLVDISMGNRIPYLLKIRQEFIVTSSFTVPMTSQTEQILLQLNSNSIFQDDSLIIHPYQFFTGMNMKHYTLTADDLDTYHVEFTPQISHCSGYECVLQLSIDSRYMPSGLGIKDIYINYGISSTNLTRLNYLNNSIVYQQLPNQWINGVPYTCFTSTAALPQQTCISTTPNKIKIALLLETFASGTPYFWKVPLLKNPSSANMPYRMNLTLWSYPTGATMGNKQLFYQIINQYYTVLTTPPSISYDITAAAQSTNTIQVSTNDLSLKFASYTATTSSVVAFKVLSFATGIIDFTTFQNGLQSDTSYTFYYFKRLGFMIAQKIANNGLLVINFGANDVSNYYSDYYGFDWLKVYSKTTMQTLYSGSQVRHLLPSCSILSMDSVSILEGSGAYQNSQYLYEFVMTSACIITQNSTLKLISSVSGLVMLPDKLCETSFRSMGCWTDGSNLYIRIDSQLPAMTQLTARIYVQSSTRLTAGQITGFIFAIPAQQQTIINNIPTITALPITVSSQLSQGKLFELLIIPLYQNTQMPIYGTFTPNFIPFTFVTIDHPFVGLIDAHQYMLYRLNNSLNPYWNNYQTFQLNWIKTIQNPTALTTTYTEQAITPDGLKSYAIQTGQQYIFQMKSTYETAGINNFLINPVGQYYQFTYQTDSQIQYQQVYPVPVSQPVIIINPLLQVSQTTALGFRFTSLYQDILPNDQITIQLDSQNLMQLMYTFNQDPIQCVQFSPGILTSNPQLVCTVQQYPDSIVPFILAVYPTNTVVAGTQVQIWISPIINPAQVMVAGVTIKVERQCFGQKLCTMYEGRGFYRTQNALTKTTYPIGTATFTPSITTVLQQSVVHTYSFPSTAVSASFISYPQNYQSVMPITCTSPGTCLIFPQQRLVVTIQSSAAVSSLPLSGMTNGIYIKPDTNIFMKLVSAANLDIYQVAHNNLTTLQIIPLTTNPTTFVITNTQTIGSIFLRNYWNTIKMQITGLYTNKFVNSFVINAPVQIMQWDTTYCNATIEDANNDPYPTRLDCAFINDTTIQILVPQGVSYQPGISDTQVMTVYAKIWIVDYPAGTGILYISPPQLSDTFNALGSFSTTDMTYNYYITQTQTPITISQHHVPIVGDIQFNTESYTQRLANINQQTSFDILIDPFTPDIVDTIQIIMPYEFGYPGIQYLDTCEMITTWISSYTDCQEIRQNNQTIIRIKLASVYDNGPRIIRLSSDYMQNLFTAPSIPGGWYNMTISLYAANGTLLQQQTTKNSSIIGGQDFYLPNMTISNGMDNSKQQIVDITFIPGQYGIKQGYSDGLSSSQVYSQIRISFQNVQGFSNLLNSQNTNLVAVGCVTNLRAYREVLCQLDQGTSVKDEPTIIITGYQTIQPYQTVRISISSILNLVNGPTQRNTLSISVNYHHVKASSQSYFMYNPAQLLFLATSPYSAVLPTALSISYTGQNIVFEPATIQITVTPTANINSYFVLKFPKDGLNNQYTRFNPVCTSCSKLQIFYRSDQIRIYPSGGVHAMGTSITYTITGFPSWQYIISFQAIQIEFQAYANLKIVNYQLYSMGLQMTGCNYNFNVMQMSSPYSGDIGLQYTFQMQVNTSYLSTSNQITAAIVFPSNYPSFDSSTVCSVVSPLVCIMQDGQTVKIQNIRQYNKSIISIVLYNVTNPGTASTSMINTYLYQGTQATNQICQSNTTINILSSPPNKCSLSVYTSHQSSQMNATCTFFIVCREAIRNNSVIKIKIPVQYTYNNPLSRAYTCWTNYRPNLLQESCQITYQNGSYYLVTLPLNVLSNQIQVDLNLMIANPLISNDYSFTAFLSHSNQVYSTTNVDNLTIYPQNSITNISSITIDYLPKSAGSDAIYFIRIPTADISTQMDIVFGDAFQWNPQALQVSYFMSNSTSLNTGYFDLLQKSHNNILPSTVNTIYNLRQVLSVDTSTVNTSQSLAWTYIILSPVTNPSYTSITNISITTYSQPTQQYYLMTHQATLPFNFTISPPSSNIHMTAYTVADNDVLYVTQHNITYRFDDTFYSNKSSFVITPPNNHISALTNISGCLYVQNILIECHDCVIGSQDLMFKIHQDGLTVLPDEEFIISLTNLYNPQSVTSCAVGKATQQDYEMSYFDLKILNNDNQISHQSIQAFFESDTPCIQFIDLRGDILTNLPDFIYSSFQYKFNVSVSIPTKSLRVYLTTNDSDLTFQPNIVYFNAYDMTYSTVAAIAQTNGINKTIEVYLTQNKSLGYDIFRPNLPILINVIANHVENVYINKLSSQSVGYQIKVPVYLSRPSIYDMFLNITPLYSSSSYSFASNFVFSTTNLYIPAYQNETYFTFLYNGNIIPETLNVSLSIFSQYNLNYVLNQSMIYFYFKTSPKYQTLPSVMSVSVMLTYQNNSAYAGRKIYYNGDQNLNYDYLKPVILQHDNFNIGSTFAKIQVLTRNQATVYYQILEAGSQYQQSPNSTELRLSNLSQSALSFRNSTGVVNVYTIINFTTLEQQTNYVLYMSAHDAFGDSNMTYVHKFKTIVLSNAIQFNLDTYTLQTDMVNVVRILSQLLQIDINRIKVTSSYKLLSLNYLNTSYKNSPVYQQNIVISPSIYNDSVSSQQTFSTMLLDNPFNLKRLQQLIPSWTGNFNSSYKINQNPFYVLNRVKPRLNIRPSATRISYYNATLKVKYWNKAHIFAVVIVQNNKTPLNNMNFIKTNLTTSLMKQVQNTSSKPIPNSKQIIYGRDAYNTQLDSKYTFNGLTDQNGVGVFYFKGLKPGQYCTVYLTATNPQEFEPYIYIDDSQVSILSFNTLWNPNLKGNQQMNLDQLKKMNPQMYQVINSYYSNKDSRNFRSAS